MAVSHHLGFYRTANSALRSVDPEKPSIEPNMRWIGCIVCDRRTDGRAIAYTRYSIYAVARNNISQKTPCFISIHQVSPCLQSHVFPNLIKGVRWVWEGMGSHRRCPWRPTGGIIARIRAASAVWKALERDETHTHTHTHISCIIRR